MAKLRQELHDYLVYVCGFEYYIPITIAGNCFWDFFYRYKDFYIYYNNTRNFIFAKYATETNDAGIPPLHNSCIDNINIDIIKETLMNAGIEVKDEFVPTFRKGDKLICVDDRSTNEVKNNKQYTAETDSFFTGAIEFINITGISNSQHASRFKKLEDQSPTIPKDINGATDFNPTSLSNLTEVIFNHLNGQHKVFAVTVNHVDNSFSVKLIGD